MEALQLYRAIAQQNRCNLDTGEAEWQGMAYGLDPEAYRE
jgi:hypothetical protein